MRRRAYYLAVACIIAASCDPVGWTYPLNRPRSQVMAPEYPASGDQDSSKVVPSVPPDTILYMCGVRMPDEYNWQRDSGIGLAYGDIVLFRNMEEVLHFPTGYDQCASTDWDTHHLIDGKLYTEFSQVSETIIKRDGETILTFNGREFLAGLVERAGSIYTLSKRRSGLGFSLRRDGAVLFECSSGTIYGSFEDSSYPRTGALYEDNGSIWFAYCIDIGGCSYSHIVKDGRDSTVANCGLDDVKVIGGRMTGVRRSTDMGFHYYDGKSSNLVGTAYRWEDCTLVNAGGKIYVAGNARNKYGTSDNFIIMDMSTGAVTSHLSGEYHLYIDGAQPNIAPASYDGFHYFSRSCMDYLDGNLYVGLSPRENKGKPCLRINDKDTEIDMPGYITGVQLVLSPPS